MSDLLSNCCYFPLRSISGDEGTSYYQCTKCLNPADSAEYVPHEKQRDHSLGEGVGSSLKNLDKEKLFKKLRKDFPLMTPTIKPKSELSALVEAWKEFDLQFSYKKLIGGEELTLKQFMKWLEKREKV